MILNFNGYGYEPGTETPTTGFCDPLNAAMVELNNVLEQAWALGLYNDTTVKQAMAVYDANAEFWSRKWFTIPFTSQCEDKTAEVTKAVNRVRTLVESKTGTKPPLIRPDFDESAGGALGTIPGWVKWTAGGVVVFLLLTQITPIIFALKPRMAGYRKVRR